MPRGRYPSRRRKSFRHRRSDPGYDIKKMSKSELFLLKLKLKYALKTFRFIDSDSSDFFAFCHSLIRRFRRDEIRKELVDYAISNNEDEMSPRVLRLDERCLSPSELYRELTIYSFSHESKYVKRVLKKALADELKLYKDYNSSQIYKRLEEISKTFALKDYEVEIIKFFYLNEIDGRFREYYHSDLEVTEIQKSVRTLSKILGITEKRIREALNKDSTLIAAGIFELNDDLSISDLNPKVTSFISGRLKGSFVDHLYTEFKAKNVLPIDKFFLKSSEEDVLKSLIGSKKGLNILFHGKPGAGKTELAKSLSKETGKKLYIINEGDGSSISDRQLALVAATKCLNPNDSIILCDEADRIINTEYSYLFYGERNDKSWHNTFLENSKSKIIWITNETRAIEESTKRRFSFSIKFKELTTKQRELVWATQIKKSFLKRFFELQDIKFLAKNFKVSPGAISLALKDIKASINENTSKSQILSNIKQILVKHSELVSGIKPALKETSKNYCLSGLNTSSNLIEVCKSLEKFSEYLKQEENPKIQNMNLLIYGPPGTGKTEFAKFLGRELEKEVITKRASDLLSPYIGMTEHYIREAFDTAESQGAILFIDEGDSFFINRESAQRSWEISQTNELLCQMENFKGIFITSTNFLENLDKASIRRFNHKVGFNYLDPKGALTFYQKILGDMVPEIIPELLEKIARVGDLTPGDFKVVWQKNAFLDRKLSHEEALKALEEEVRARDINKSRKIGF